MEPHKRQKHPRQAGRTGRLIEELRLATGRLTDDQRDRLIRHLHRQEHDDGQGPETIREADHGRTRSQGEVDHRRRVST